MEKKLMTAEELQERLTALEKENEELKKNVDELSKELKEKKECFDEYYERYRTLNTVIKAFRITTEKLVSDYVG